jgi:protein-S-isoprenylcysteine O-methyltransferase Ste14
VPSRLRVSLGWALGILVFSLARPTSSSLALGLPLVALGEIVRLWASGHIEKTLVLATGCPYAHTRNPLYFGSVLLALGLAVAAASFWVAGAVLVYFAAFYPSVMREEADFLRRKFPVEYRAWEAGVPVFLPRIVPAGPRTSRFSWARVRANKEWRTAAALPVVAGLLWARGLLAGA